MSGKEHVWEMHGSNLGMALCSFATDSNRTAVVFRGEKTTYRKLEDQASRLAMYLKEQKGVAHGDRVAILSRNCPEYYAAFFACAKLGAVFVPLSTMSDEHTLLSILTICAPSVILASAEFADRAVRYDGAILCHLDDPDLREALTHGEKLSEQELSCWDDDFAILFSSGTTGIPKGALVTQRNVGVSAQQRIEAYHYDRDDAMLIMLQLCFTGALIGLSLPVLMAGGTIYLEQKFDADTAVEMIEKNGITRFSGASTVFTRIGNTPAFEAGSFSSIRMFETGGAPIPSTLYDLFRRKGVDFSAMYGMTETCGGFLLQTYQEDGDVHYLPLSGNQARIADDDWNTLPDGELGEVLLRGPSVMKGYYKLLNQTKELMQDGWLRTGDLGVRFSDGTISIRGRKKDLIISGGYNIVSTEVEEIIARCPGVKDVAVVGLPHPDWGEAVTAFVCAKPGEEVNVKDLIRICKEHLAGYMVPKAVIFVDEMPLSVGKKIIKKTLREKHLNYYTE